MFILNGVMRKCVEGMGKLVGLPWGREVHVNLGLYEEPMKENDVDG